MDIIKKVNVPMALLCLVIARLIFSDSSVALAIVGLGVAGLYAYNMYLGTKKTETINEEVRRELDVIKNQMSGLAVKNNLKPMPGPNQKFF